jgi:uncharacterized protein YyaL (SSP411 family)
VKSNALINETSPYLLQHAHNPVNWVAWSPAVFEQAKKENKLVLISIGYSACHWCHVMEHESFENETVAAVMNTHFINVKIDREERPDVDMLYMSAVQLMAGQGGWPLNCFVLPDGRPVYGGTYFRREQWINILQNLHNLFEKEPEKVFEYATNLTEGIKQTELINHKKGEESFLNKSVLEKSIENWKKRFDNKLGGPNRAPKFPLPNNYSFLLKYGHLYNDNEVIKHVELTLQKMACGGIYDQLGGGFARYSVDVYWKIPHFEKMLYDNAQLVTLYCEAYRYNKSKLYAQVVFETLAFAERKWLDMEGGFYSAMDADSEGVEGKYYVWEKHELKELLKENYDVFADYYNVNEIGYWEDDNYVLVRTENTSEILVKHHLKEDGLEKIISDSKRILFETRLKRVRPGIDNKILTSWNALMCKAYCEAYLTFKNEHYKNMALRNSEFIKTHLMKKDNSLWRSYNNGKPKVDGFLDDYAFTIDAFISIYTISQNEEWLKLAQDICEYTLQHFHNKESDLFYYTAETGEKLLVRTSETSDNVIPASNSQMACNLYKLGKILGNNDYKEKASLMINHFSEEIMHYGSGFSNWASLYIDLLNDSYEVCIVGNHVNEILLKLYNHYLPNTIFVVSASASELDILKQRFVEGKTLIYICKNKACQKPTEDIKEAFEQLETTL